MIFFWANIDESDIEAFAGTLVLPSYMSHLSLAPFRFSQQPANPDGRESLILTYVSEGRVEERSLLAKKHALALLQYAFPFLTSESVRLPENGVIWNWTAPPPPGNYTSDTFIASLNCREPEQGRLRIFFEPIQKTLFPPDSAEPFSPFQTYVSVSRRELFIGSQILTAFFRAWINQLSGTAEYIAQGASHRPFVDSLPILLEIKPQGIAFSATKIGGELLVENDTVFSDLLRFAGLTKPLQEIAHLVVPDLNSRDTQIGEAGILLRLVASPGNSEP